MIIHLNDTELTIPSSKKEFTLGRRIAFEEEHGHLLKQMLEFIMKMEDEEEKKIELVSLHFEQMFRTFSFFTNVSLDAVRESEFMDQIAYIYYHHLAPLMDDDETIIQKTEFLFNNETWVLPATELKHGDAMSFGEIIDSKQRVKDMAEIGLSKVEQLLPLSAIYLRKKEEDYKEEFLYEGSERQELMKSLPMDIAEQVGFFLRRSMNFFMQILMCLRNQKQRSMVSI